MRTIPMRLSDSPVGSPTALETDNILPFAMKPSTNPAERKSVCTLRTVSSVAVVLAILLAGALVALGVVGSMLSSKQSGGCLSPECIHALGGGPVGPGGDFGQRVLPPKCSAQLQAYGDPEHGTYWTEVELAGSMAIQALKLNNVCKAQQPVRFPRISLEGRPGSSTSHNTPTIMTRRSSGGAAGLADGPLPPPSKEQVVIFDIDETVLSNLPFVLHPEKYGTWDAWVSLAAAPPLLPVRCFYLSLVAAGYSVVFLTGRKESSRENTMKNLAAVGYGKPCAGNGSHFGFRQQPGWGPMSSGSSSNEPCYSALLLRPPGDTRLASVYKPWARQQLLGIKVPFWGAAQGAAQDKGERPQRELLPGGSKNGENGNLTLLALVGDQFSDINGETSAPYAFKLPNPFYYIL